ncbi:DUF6386 family protein [Shewanella algae]|uniref:DUF6386 family protein n=1 Tax=Shewanella algae TaxID=38313 RepID=UPI0031F4D8BB
MSYYDFSTDTSTLCVFDLESMKHRFYDDADWWSIQRDALLEMNNGNVAFISLPEDGDYSFSIIDEIFEPSIEVNLNAPSGHLFIGAGEEVTSDELEPECVRGGIFLDLKPGKYTLKARVENQIIFISFCAAVDSVNTFNKNVNLEW